MMIIIIFLLNYLSFFIPSVKLQESSCPCSRGGKNICQGGPYVDYYYNAPYSGSPPNYSYLPPIESLPAIYSQLTIIRDGVKGFLDGTNQANDSVHKALYVKENFKNIQHLLQAVDFAANHTDTTNK